MGAQRQNIASRLAALRSGVTGISLQGLTLNSPDSHISDDLTDNSAYTPVTGGAASSDATLFDNERFGLFVNGNIGWGERDGTVKEDGYDFDTYSITAGLDYRFTDGLIAGIGLGYNNSNTNIDHSGGSLDSDGYTLSLYGTFYQGRSFYLDGIISYGNNSYDQERNIRYGIGAETVNQTASSDYDGDFWSGSIGAGYDISSGASTFGPVVRLDYMSASVDGYSEAMSDPNTSGGGWAVKMENFDQDSLTSYLGAKYAFAVSTKTGVLVPQLDLGWVHDFNDDGLGVSGSFVQDPDGGMFLIQGDKPDSDYYVAAFGLSAQFAGGVAAYLQYNKIFGYKDLDVDNISAGVRLSF